MRIIFSDEYKKLHKKIEPYLVKKGLTRVLKDDAPEEIKKAKEELDELFEKEYQKEI